MELYINFTFPLTAPGLCYKTRIKMLNAVWKKLYQRGLEIKVGFNFSSDFVPMGFDTNINIEVAHDLFNSFMDGYYRYRLLDPFDRVNNPVIPKKIGIGLVNNPLV